MVTSPSDYDEHYFKPCAQLKLKIKHSLKHMKSYYIQIIVILV